jgi:predicted nucleotidyltransferase
MLTSLLSSKTRIDLLKLFLINANNSYYPRQIESLLKVPYTSVRRELQNLEKIGLLNVELEVNRKYYSVNKNFPLFSELKSIILKTAGIGDKLKSLVKNYENIQIAFIYGSYAKNSEKLSSDIDLFIIGDVTLKDLQEALIRLEKELGREINCTIFPPEEFRQKIKNNNHFIKTVLKEPRIFLKGMEHDIRKLV